jgi:3-methylfumaryl-CoA hydratase
MDELQGWIGRTREQEDEITRPALRRIAALLDRADEFPIEAPIPPHWYAMFFPDIAPQSQIGEDGHPRRGDFLPPVALPRRMFAGRRMRFLRPLRVGDTAAKHSEIVAITPKRGRSGEMVFVTIRHTVTVAGEPIITDEQDVVYREAATKGAPPPAPTPALADAAWSERVIPSTVLLFRYSAITYNAHRIHYDADYVRGTEGYPGLVVNGGLTLLLLLEAAIRNVGRTPRGVAVRNIRPLYCGDAVTLAGSEAAAWAADGSGALAVSAELEL